MNIDERMASLQNKLNDRLKNMKQSHGFSFEQVSLMPVQEINPLQDTPVQSGGQCAAPAFYCPECGKPVPAAAKFCPECGCCLDLENCEENYSAGGGEDGVGIIMTDTRLLAKKYNTNSAGIKAIIENFMDECREMDFRWHLLDIADCQSELGEATWMDYSDVLEKFCNRNALKKGPKLSLFIIGGNDVIPQPCEDNPCYTPSPWGDNEYQEKVYSDFYYCFYGKLKLDFLDYNKARCNVARLPLESGEMKSSAEYDLAGYLRRVLECMDNDGIDIGRAVMTSNVDWIPASREMSRNLPTECLENSEDEVLDNMYISPDVVAEMDDDLREQYYSSLADADMLVFNLHGACQPSMSGFYSSELAFSTHMLAETNAKIFNTVACWGARYIKYKREQSMLLTALYNHGIMLYSGACVPAMGKCGNYQHDSTWRIQPAAYSETFMARFAEYQCIGTMAAGEAFLKAKCDYYNTSRAVEEDEVTLATVLMFNLYGCPALRTTPNTAALAEIQNDDGSKMYRIPFRPRKKEAVMRGDQKMQQSGGSILDAVRGAVDNNLRQIHDVIVDRLYNALGVTPRELFLVEKYTTTDIDGNQQKGYLYHYNKDKAYNVRTHIQVSLDEAGNIRDAIQTK